ncbi:oxaloacetate decarboxylase [Pseudonocardia hispaniensis]|uniref:Oxaloacetate decarboxylase n=1 Tax=Pseudonocardia hispaniensis TaxID=904933 RepID=A0ABW1J5X9_9PSEU
MTADLAQLLATGPVLAAGVYDCLSAAVMQEAGFPALALSGAGVAMAAAGVPDLGLLSFGELLHTTAALTRRARVPVIVDADTGFGNPLNVTRTCEDLARAGADAIVLEDQTFPKRCGHLTGKQVTEAGEFIAKLRAARRALDGTATLLIARIDALAVHGVQDAIVRATRAHDAGADVTFVEAPTSRQEVEEIAATVPGLKMYNLATGGRSPSLSAADLDELGFRLILVPGLALMPAIAAMRDAAAEVLATGSDAPLLRYGLSPRDMFEVVGLSRWLRLESDFAVD